MRLICFLLLQSVTLSEVIDFELDAGGIPDDSSLETAWKNGALMNATLERLKPHDIFLLPDKTFYVMGGIVARRLALVTLKFDGILRFTEHIHQWPRSRTSGRLLECIELNNARNVTIQGKGTLDGQGDIWWGVPGIGYLVHGEHRPRLLNVAGAKNLLIEGVRLVDSPYWTLWAHGVDGVEIRGVKVDVRRTRIDKHTVVDLTAFNTDGIDISGRNVHIHHCDIWNQDDCIAVKDDSENMLFEHIDASGVGLTIGSIAGGRVRNITFRNIAMHHSFKGIYMKFRGGNHTGSIEDVTYENIFIDRPSQWPIWIGPAQQSDSKHLCAAHPCSLCWPMVPFAECNAPAGGSYRNVLLKNVTIKDPRTSPGVIFANDTNPMVDVVFQDVVVKSPGERPFDDEFYFCQGVKSGVARGRTWPVPPCFDDHTYKRSEPEVANVVPSE